MLTTDVDVAFLAIVRRALTEELLQVVAIGLRQFAHLLSRRRRDGSEGRRVESVQTLRCAFGWPIGPARRHIVGGHAVPGWQSVAHRPKLLGDVGRDASDHAPSDRPERHPRRRWRLRVRQDARARLIERVDQFGEGTLPGREDPLVRRGGWCLGIQRAPEAARRRMVGLVKR
jgi:hypothetical protein